jgi:hypothetical protein
MADPDVLIEKPRAEVAILRLNRPATRSTRTTAAAWW